jgi:hypothetical protein
MLREAVRRKLSEILSIYVQLVKVIPRTEKPSGNGTPLQGNTEENKTG